MDDIATRQVPGSDCEVIHADVVEQVRQNMPPDSEVYDLSDFFKVIRADGQSAFYRNQIIHIYNGVNMIQLVPTADSAN